MQVSQALAQLIEGWIARGKHNNLNVLHNRTGVSYSTVTRLAQGKAENPQLEVVISILPIVANEAEKNAFLKQYYPGVFKLVEKNDAYQGPTKPVVTNNAEFDELFKDRVGFMIGQHLLSRAGISTSKVKELFGEAGFDIIKELESKELVDFADGVWKATFDYSAKSADANKQQIISGVKSFQSDSVKVSAGFMGTMSESVTLEAAQEMTKELQETWNRLRSIRDNNPGQHIFVTSASTFLSDPKMAIDEMEASE